MHMRCWALKTLPSLLVCRAECDSCSLHSTDTVLLKLDFLGPEAQELLGILDPAKIAGLQSDMCPVWDSVVVYQC